MKGTVIKKKISVIKLNLHPGKKIDSNMNKLIKSLRRVKVTNRKRVRNDDTNNKDTKKVLRFVNSEKQKLVNFIRKSRFRSYSIWKQVNMNCWFHALIYFLMCQPESQRRFRFVLMNNIQKMTDEQVHLFNVPPHMCQKFGTLPSEYNLLRFVYHFLFNTQQSKPVNVRQVINLLNHTRYQEVAKNNFNLSKGSNSIYYIQQIIEKLGIGIPIYYIDVNKFINASQDMFVTTTKLHTNFRNSNVKQENINGFKIVSSLIKLKSNIGGTHSQHIICGYFSPDYKVSFIIDSNYSFPIICDISNTKSILENETYKKLCTELYGFTFTSCDYAAFLYKKI